VEPRRARLIEEHVPLVDHVVRRVATSFPGYVDRGELLSAGRLGLTEAACRFEFERNVPFAPYAARRFRGSVLDHLRSHDWVPRSARERSRSDEEVARAVAVRGRVASLDELATTLGVTPSRVSQLRAHAIEVLRHGLESQFEDDGAGAPPTRPKGRDETRQAQFAASVARHSDWRTRLAGRRWSSSLTPPTTTAGEDVQSA
jgi:DNA-directed RNA polymerase specialized sigma subunit